MTLSGKTIAILVAPRGIADPEFARPKAAVEQAGGEIVEDFAEGRPAGQAVGA